MSYYLKTVLWLTIAGCSSAPVIASPWQNDQAGANRLPNIVIVYADDLGQGDLSCYNDECAYQTPRLDQMAREGIRFTDAHSPSTICSPSRYGLYSGQQIYRSTGRGGGAFEGPGGPSYLKLGTLTLGQMLKAKGYKTGVFGKWHVGLTWLDKDGKRLGGGFENSTLIDYEKSTPLVDGPNRRGFDESFVTPNCPNTDPLYVYIENGMVPEPASQRHHRENLPNPGGKWRWDNDEGWMAPGYDFINADLLFFEKTKNFITQQVKQSPDQPFLAVLSTQIAHAPVLPADEFNDATEGGPRGDFVFELDAIVGRLLDLLKELKIDDNTIVIFNSDNGAETLHVNWMREDHNHDPAAGRRGMKRDGWEGGHRVPLIVRWPSRIPAGQVTSQMTNTTDIMATLASIVGYSLKPTDAVDSFDMLPVLLGRQDESEPIRPHLLTQSFRGEFQLRVGNWKYLDHQGSGGNRYDRQPMLKWRLPESEPEAPGQLYDLSVDPGETSNLYFKNEARRIELQQLLEQLKTSGRSAPLERKPIGIENIPVVKQNAARASGINDRPNIVLIMADDMGYTDIGCYGSEIKTPTLDGLAENGIRLTQFYNTSRCCPTRASLLTGLYSHQAGIGLMTGDRGFDAYRGDLNRRCVTIAEALKPGGYRNYMSGKWHVTKHTRPNSDQSNWPLQRGFDRFYGTIIGAGSFFDPATLCRGNQLITPANDPEYQPNEFYYTDAISDNAVAMIREHCQQPQNQPFFLYVAYTTAHWPMHALESDIRRYQGVYDQGFEPIRKQRYQRAVEQGVLNPNWNLSPGAVNWDDVPHQEWDTRNMQVYAAMVDRMDQGIGRIVAELKQQDRFENTIIVYLQDNGGCAEAYGRRPNPPQSLEKPVAPMAADDLQFQIWPPMQTRDGRWVRTGPEANAGPEDTFVSYGQGWANVSNTPFRGYKHDGLEGGISSPLIIHYPQGIQAAQRNSIHDSPSHLIDIMPTLLEQAGIEYPAQYHGRDIHPLEGVSLTPLFTGGQLKRNQPLCFEHHGNLALRDGRWKIVSQYQRDQPRKWQLYDMENDRTELQDLATEHPDQLSKMVADWQRWADRVGVQDWPFESLSHSNQ